MGLDKSRIGDILEVIGSVSLTIGAGMVYLPAAFIVAGVLLVLAGAAAE
jgi:amino acid permease